MQAKLQDGGGYLKELLWRQQEQSAPSPPPEFCGQLGARTPVVTVLLPPPVFLGIGGHEKDVAPAFGCRAQELLPHEEVTDRAVAVLLGIHVARRNALPESLLARFSELGAFLGAEGRPDPACQRMLQSGDHRIGARVVGDALPFTFTDLGDLLLYLVEDTRQSVAEICQVLVAQGHSVCPGAQGLHRSPGVATHLLGGTLACRPRITDDAFPVPPELVDDLVRNPEAVSESAECPEKVGSSLLRVPVEIQQHVRVGGDQAVRQYGGEVHRRCRSGKPRIRRRDRDRSRRLSCHPSQPPPSTSRAGSPVPTHLRATLAISRAWRRQTTGTAHR